MQSRSTMHAARFKAFRLVCRVPLAVLHCRRKQRQVTMQLDELGMENLETQLHDATERPAEPSHRLATVMAVRSPLM